MKELTKKLPFTAKELNLGIAQMRRCQVSDADVNYSKSQ